MALTTTSSLPAPLQATFNMRLLPWKQPNLIMKLAADYYRMPASGGTTLRLRRYTKLVPPVVPIGRDVAEYKSWVIDLESEVAFS